MPEIDSGCTETCCPASVGGNRVANSAILRFNHRLHVDHRTRINAREATETAIPAREGVLSITAVWQISTYPTNPTRATIFGEVLWREVRG